MNGNNNVVTMNDNENNAMVFTLGLMFFEKSFSFILTSEIK